MSTPSQARILVVDDEPALATALCATLKLEGYTAEGFTSGEEALRRLAQQPFELLLTDLMMPGMDGIELLRAAQRIDRDLAAIVMTGHGTIETAVNALQSGALDYVLKPFRLDNLLPVLARCLSIRRLQTENIRLRESVSIHELARAITRGLDRSQIIERTLAAAMQQHEAGFVSVLVPVEGGTEFRIAGVLGDDAPWEKDGFVTPEWPMDVWVTAAREQLSRWDGSNAPGVVFEHPFNRQCGGIALPIVAGSRLYALLIFAPAAAQRRPGPGHIKALDILANTAAAALESDSLLARLKSSNQELERRVRERTQELEVSNADLEAFSYSVSHDLRAPLRTIDGFCELLTESYSQNLPEDGRDCVAKVRAGVTRMQRLIDDLLHLSRFSRQPLEKRNVHMSELVRKVAAALASDAKGRNVQLQIGALPDCHGDVSLLEQVFVNLLSNAYKFTSTRDVARIEVGSFAENGEQVYFVKDNGVGFDMKYAEGLFGVFQRMHSQAQFPGTGIGLSIVQRIVRRHGGRTWAESRPAEGTTLFFSLPDQLSVPDPRC